MGVCEWDGSLLHFDETTATLERTVLQNGTSGAVMVNGGNVRLVSVSLLRNCPLQSDYPSLRRNVICDDEGTLDISGLVDGGPPAADVSLWILNRSCEIVGVPEGMGSVLFIPKLQSVNVTKNETHFYFGFSGTDLMPCVRMTFQLVAYDPSTNTTQIVEYPLSEVGDGSTAGGAVPIREVTELTNGGGDGGVGGGDGSGGEGNVEVSVGLTVDGVPVGRGEGIGEGGGDEGGSGSGGGWDHTIAVGADLQVLLQPEEDNTSAVEAPAAQSSAVGKVLAYLGFLLLGALLALLIVFLIIYLRKRSEEKSSAEITPEEEMAPMKESPIVMEETGSTSGLASVGTAHASLSASRGGSQLRLGSGAVLAAAVPTESRSSLLESSEPSFAEVPSLVMLPADSAAAFPAAGDTMGAGMDAPLLGASPARKKKKKKKQQSMESESGETESGGMGAAPVSAGLAGFTGPDSGGARNGSEAVLEDLVKRRKKKKRRTSGANDGGGGDAQLFMMTE
jgi:hypothetical protein